MCSIDAISGNVGNASRRQSILSWSTQHFPQVEPKRAVCYSEVNRSNSAVPCLHHISSTTSRWSVHSSEGGFWLDRKSATTSYVPDRYMALRLERQGKAHIEESLSPLQQQGQSGAPLVIYVGDCSFVVGAHENMSVLQLW